MSLHLKKENHKPAILIDFGQVSDWDLEGNAGVSAKIVELWAPERS